MKSNKIFHQENDLDVTECEDSRMDWMDEFTKLRRVMIKQFEENTVKSKYKHCGALGGFVHYINDSRGRRYV